MLQDKEFVHLFHPCSLQASSHHKDLRQASTNCNPPSVKVSQGGISEDICHLETVLNQADQIYSPVSKLQPRHTADAGICNHSSWASRYFLNLSAKNNGLLSVSNTKQAESEIDKDCFVADRKNKRLSRTAPALILGARNQQLPLAIASASGQEHRP